jgi:23S rRNA (cytidine1920-2'-O)/16S rRNA (cytidine1409-2'-O)-methyltransferase
MMMKYRLDTLLHIKGFFESRNKAANAISEGRVKVNGVLIDKPSFVTEEDALITIMDGDNFVSRAYRKLSAALEKFGISASDVVTLDIGASTGGFTQCLLERGAKKVYAVDVGVGQLHPSLKSDNRVVNMESTNARDLKKSDFSEEITLVVMDVSFISQSKIYPSVSDILSAGGLFISLVKPQFEVGRNNIGKNGIVKDKDGKLIASVREFLKNSAAENGLIQKAFTASPITGGDGNKEYLSLFIRS